MQSEIKPPHVQVADMLRHQINAGELVPGAPLPTLRKLAETWHISQATAKKAVAILVQEGLVGEPSVGRNTVVLDRRLDLLKQSADSAADMLRRVANGHAVSADDLHAMADALTVLTR